MLLVAASMPAASCACWEPQLAAYVTEQAILTPTMSAGLHLPGGLQLDVLPQWHGLLPASDAAELHAHHQPGHHRLPRRPAGRACRRAVDPPLAADQHGVLQALGAARCSLCALWALQALLTHASCTPVSCLLDHRSRQTKSAPHKLSGPPSALLQPLSSCLHISRSLAGQLQHHGRSAVSACCSTRQLPSPHELLGRISSLG